MTNKNEDLNQIINFGKHKGKKISNILKDKSYIEWLVNNPEIITKFNLTYFTDEVIQDLKDGFEKDKNFTDPLDQPITFGKYKGKYMRDLIKDKGYLEWVSNNHEMIIKYQLQYLYHVLGDNKPIDNQNTSQKISNNNDNFIDENNIDENEQQLFSFASLNNRQ